MPPPSRPNVPEYALSEGWRMPEVVATSVLFKRTSGDFTNDGVLERLRSTGLDLRCRHGSDW